MSAGFDTRPLGVPVYTAWRQQKGSLARLCPKSAENRLASSVGKLRSQTPFMGVLKHIAKHIHTSDQSPVQGQFVNPVIRRDWPDPNCIFYDGRFHTYATNRGKNVQHGSSTDLVNWVEDPDALPRLPAWAQPGLTWAPSVTEIRRSPTDNFFVLYFVARDRASGKQAIGQAVADTPYGPFEPTSDVAFLNQVDLGGTIDPHLFVDDDGSKWLLSKNDGNSVGRPTFIHVCLLTPDALKMAGPLAPLFRNDQAWEGGVVEAPFLWKHSGRYYLFYSGNGFGTGQYAIGYAVSDAVAGPYTKCKQPIVSTRGKVVGPGACCLIKGPNSTTWMLYHHWDPTHSHRPTSLAQLHWDGDKPVVTTTLGTPCNCPFSDTVDVESTTGHSLPYPHSEH